MSGADLSRIDERTAPPRGGTAPSALLSQALHATSEELRNAEALGEASPFLDSTPWPSAGLRVGALVRIRGPGQVHHKLLSYAHQQAVVLELPERQNSWYTVRALRNGRVFKIRRRAFDVEAADGAPPLLSLGPGVLAHMADRSDPPGAAGSDGLSSLPDEDEGEHVSDDPPRHSSAPARAGGAGHGTGGAAGAGSGGAGSNGERVTVAAGAAGAGAGQSSGAAKERGSGASGAAGSTGGAGGNAGAGGSGGASGSSGGAGGGGAGGGGGGSGGGGGGGNSSSSRRRKRPQKSRNLVGLWVMVESGRYKGEVGLVVRGGNGYYSVELRSEGKEPLVVMKRSTDLVLTSPPGEESGAHSGADSEAEREEGLSSNDHTEEDSADAAPRTRRRRPARSGGWRGGDSAMGASSRGGRGGGDMAEDEGEGEGDGEGDGDADGDRDRDREGDMDGDGDGDLDGDGEGDEDEDGGGARIKRPRLSPAARESWVGRQVYIRGGKFHGLVGVVKSSGHGFYAVAVPGVESEIMKRASELELCDVQAVQAAVETDELSMETLSEFKDAALMLVNLHADALSPRRMAEKRERDRDRLSPPTSPLGAADADRKPATPRAPRILQPPTGRIQSALQRFAAPVGPAAAGAGATAAASAGASNSAAHAVAQSPSRGLRPPAFTDSPRPSAAALGGSNMPPATAPPTPATAPAAAPAEVPNIIVAPIMFSGHQMLASPQAAMWTDLLPLYNVMRGAQQAQTPAASHQHAAH